MPLVQLNDFFYFFSHKILSCFFFKLIVEEKFGVGNSRLLSVLVTAK